ncbi:hypothetical protein ACFP2F_14225 [Hymenobacter artigasi]|uniref:Uncharacterized protein n=1 Tax=Hymenobacter artigasi TaxID=2719616 RepID=A0ABX1HKG4_9BACT|nr:hypothetical protein [Hymenobacter artigasi]NKI90769.1 hypothetical protein [Hymenobacter artigasi]
MKRTLFFILSLGLLSGATATAARPLRGGFFIPPVQTGPVPTPAPAPEPPVKAVPLSGHQPKPQRVDDDGQPTDPADGPNHPNHSRRAGRAAHHAHTHGPGHGHGRQH